MMNLFKRKKPAEPEAKAKVVAAEPAPEPLPEPVPEPVPEPLPEPVPEPAPEPAPEQSADYQPWDPEGAPPELVMEEPKADATELEAIANAGTIDEQIVAALKKVYDPEIPVDIYEMGLIYGVDVSEEKDVAIQMTLTSPGCPVAGQMPGMVEHAVHSFVEGVRDVEVEIVWDPPWTPDRMSEAAQLELGFM